MKYGYLLMFIMGFILTIYGIWLLYRKDPILEGLADTSRVILAGVNGGSLMYVATSNLTTSPKWEGVTGQLKQFSGSLGQIVGVSDTNTIRYGANYGPPGSPYSWVDVPGVLKQLDFDYPMVTGINVAGVVQYIDDITTSPTTAVLKNTTSDKIFKWINVSVGRGYGIGTDDKIDKIWYAEDIRKPTWIDVTRSIAGKTFIQVSYDGDDVVVLTSTNILFYANTGLESTPNWTQLSGTFKQVSLKNHMIFGIGTDDKIYFSPSQVPDSAFIALTTNTATTTPAIRATDAIAATPATTTTANNVKMTYIDCFYPRSSNMVSQRPATINPCKLGFSYFGGECLNTCPTGFTEEGKQCIGTPIVRASRPASIVPPPTFTCPTGFDVELTSVATCFSLIENKIVATLPLKEVYGIPDSKYTKVQAEAKCQSYGGNLATTAQVTAAQVAGADWCACAWVSDGDGIYPISRPNGTVVGGCGGPNSGIKYCPTQAATLWGANCYGVKPPKGQFIDVMPFITNGRWNQAEQCPFGHVINTTGTCNKTCPTGSFPSGGTCIFPVVVKNGAGRMTTNYTCPAGYDPPSNVTCSGSGCGAAQTCYQSCPTGYTRSGTSCTGPITPRGVKPALQISSYSCAQAGALLQGSTCWGACPTGATRIQGDTRCKAGFWSFITTTSTAAVSSPTYSCLPFDLNSATYRDFPNKIGTKCFANCPAGTVDIGNNQCQLPAIPARLTTAATYIRPCPVDYVDIDEQCFKSCTTGSTDIGNNKCQFPSVIRTTSNPTKITTSPQTLCNTTEDLINTNCLTKCAPGLNPSGATCVASPTPRTGTAAIFNCNSNETLLNGVVCTTKCPAGTYPDGDLCVPEEKVVMPPANIGCTSSPYGTAKKWFCTSGENAAALLKDPSPTTTYVDPTDQVCVSDDPTTNMYFCESGADAKGKTGALDNIRSNYNATCDNVKKNYLDLSNNITTLLLIQSGMGTGKDKLALTKTTLNDIYTKLNCTTPSTQISSVCNNIKTAVTTIGTNSTNIGDVLTNITTPIQAAVTAQASLLASMTNFQCSL